MSTHMRRMAPFALVLLAAVPARAQTPASTPAPAPAPAPADAPAVRAVSLLDVRLACLNPRRDSSAVLTSICVDLQLPRASLRDSASWGAWTAAWERKHLADTLRAYARYDPRQLPLSEVLRNLDPAEAARVIGTLLRKENELRAAVLGLAKTRSNPFAELYHAATDTSRVRPPELRQLADKLRSTLAPQDSSNDLRIDKGMQEAISTLTQAELVVLLGTVPAMRDTVVSRLAADQRVESILGRTANGDLRGAVARAAAETFAPTAAARSPAISRQSDLLWGATDFVVNRVQQQMQAYALRGFSARLCADLGASVLHESCGMLHAESFGLSRPGVTLLRSAVRQDLQALPYSMLEWSYGRYGSALPAARADQVLTAIHVTRFALGTARGDDPWLALGAVADQLHASQDSLGRAAADLRARIAAGTLEARAKEAAQARLADVERRLAAAGTRADAPVSTLIVTLAEFASTRFDALRLRNVAPPELGGDEILRYQLIAMLANVQERPGATPGFAPHRFVPVVLALADDFRRLERLRATADSLARVRPDSAIGGMQLRMAQAAFGVAEQFLSEAAQSETFGDTAFAHLAAARQTVEAMQDVVFPVLQGEYGTGLLALTAQVNQYLPAGSPPARAWSRGMVFVTDLVNAGNPDQVNAALARFVDSGGGFVAKRNGPRLRAGLGLYGGVYGGFEVANDDRSGFMGLYLPVGLDITLPVTVRPWGRPLGRFGLFLQAADLGALASWRLNSDSTVNERPRVGVAQVFSPGAFLVFNVTGAPLTVGYGWARSPELREINRDGEEPIAVDATRRGFFIAFDIPLFP